jgi:hypothetical protein
MTGNPWTTPEAEAYFESEWQNALKQAEEAVDKAFGCEKIWSGLSDWLKNEPEKVAGYVGADNYKLFADFLYAKPLLPRLLAEEFARAKKDAVA